MKKIKKVLSGMIAVVTLAAGMTFPVSATEEQIYTYAELLEMSDEAFLQLEGAQEYYDIISNDVANKEYGGISGSVYSWLEKEDLNIKYTANVTENSITRLLGNNVEYSICSPISIDVDELMDIGEFAYQNIFSVDFPTFEKRSDSNTITDKEIIQFAKCCFCINQIIPVEYYKTLEPLYGDSGEKIVIGDVNFDRTVSTLDAVHMAKLNAGYYKSTDAQRKVADLNNDGKINSSDICILIEDLLGNYELI